MGLMVVLEAIQTTLAAARPDITVEIGDGLIVENYNGPRVYFILPKRGKFTGPKLMSRSPVESFADIQWECKAHLWTAETTDRTLRWTHVETLIHDVSRAIYAEAHGAKASNGMPHQDVEIDDDAESMKFGESAILTFIIGGPITKGTTKISAPAGTHAARPTMSVNPESEE